MSKLLRLPVKYIRDKAKSAYVKDSSCRICSTNDNLEFHHYYSMTLMLEKWVSKNKLKLDTVESIMEHRDKFIADHHEKIYEKTVTLCDKCHKKLHNVYGAKPNLGTGEKQSRWVERMRDGMV